MAPRVVLLVDLELPPSHAAAELGSGVEGEGDELRLFDSINSNIHQHPPSGRPSSPEHPQLDRGEVQRDGSDMQRQPGQEPVPEWLATAIASQTRLPPTSRRGDGQGEEPEAKDQAGEPAAEDVNRMPTAPAPARPLRMDRSAPRP